MPFSNISDVKYCYHGHGHLPYMVIMEYPMAIQITEFVDGV